MKLWLKDAARLVVTMSSMLDKTLAHTPPAGVARQSSFAISEKSQGTLVISRIFTKLLKSAWTLFAEAWNRRSHYNPFHIKFPPSTAATQKKKIKDDLGKQIECCRSTDLMHFWCPLIPTISVLFSTLVLSSFALVKHATPQKLFCSTSVTCKTATVQNPLPLTKRIDSFESPFKLLLLLKPHSNCCLSCWQFHCFHTFGVDQVDTELLVLMCLKDMRQCEIASGTKLLWG